jgi:hypothetical protein
MTKIDLSRLRTQTKLVIETPARLPVSAWAEALGIELVRRLQAQEAAARTLVGRLSEQDASLRAAVGKAELAKSRYAAALAEEDSLRIERDLVFVETTTAHSRVEEALRQDEQCLLREIEVLRLLQQAQAAGLTRKGPASRPQADAAG